MINREGIAARSVASSANDHASLLAIRQGASPLAVQLSGLGVE